MHTTPLPMIKNRGSYASWSLFIVCILLLNPFFITKAAAAGCFRIAKSAQDSNASKRQSSSLRVTLASVIGVEPSCEYAFDSQGPWRGDLAEQKHGEFDFATLIFTLRGKGPSANQPARPTAIFARKKNLPKSIAAAQIESVFLAGCTEYLLSTGRAFALTVPVETQQPTIARVSGANECDAADLTLYFAPLEDATSPGVVQKGPWSNSLTPEARQYTLRTGRWAVYGARVGAEVGYLVGRISSGSSYTPLRAGLLARKMEKAGPEEPWLRASWESGPLRFNPTTDALRSSDLWAELRTAAAADALWLAKGTTEEGAAPLGRLLLADNGNSIALPSASVTEQMQRRYGPAGKYLVPTYEDWGALRDDLQVCLAPRYEATRVASAQLGRLPAGSTCSALASLTAPFATQGGEPTASGRVCVRKRPYTMSADGEKRQGKVSETCAFLPTGAPTESKSDFLLAALSDEVRLSGATPSPLSLCIDNQCQPLPADVWLPLSKAGLVEIRRGATTEQALASQGLTLLRLGVIDIATAWHPVGLYSGNDNKPPANRWTALEHDEPEVFTYLRRRNRLDFHLETSPTLSAAWNARPDLVSQMNQQVPVVGGVKGKFTGARPTTFAALVSREAACPKDTAAEWREKPLVNPEKLLIDQLFYVHLAQYQGEDKPFECVARAGFRVAERNSIPVLSPIRVGLFGDTQLMLFITSKPALGVALPLAYAYWRLVFGFGVDASVSLTMAGTFNDAELSRTGLGFSASAVCGPEYDLPRLISVGGMLHLATGTARKQPIGSIFIGCNLASLFDIAGGR